MCIRDSVLLLGLGHGLGHQTLHAVVNVGDRLVYRIGLGGLLRLRLLGRDLVQLVQIGLGLLCLLYTSKVCRQSVRSFRM